MYNTMFSMSLLLMMRPFRDRERGQKRHLLSFTYIGPTVVRKGNNIMS